MKKALLSIAIALSSIAIIGITASSFIVGEIGSIVCLCGIMTGVSGLLIGGVVGGIEYTENKKNNQSNNLHEIKTENYTPEIFNDINKNTKQEITTNWNSNVSDNTSEITK